MERSQQNPQAYLDRFGLQAFRPGQQPVIEAVLAGEDVLCIMPTGGGKSLCYQLPTLMRPGVTLVISPLIALMKDQVDSLRQRGVPAGLVNSSQSPAEQAEVMEQMRAGDLQLVYVAPERFRSPRFLDALRECHVQLVAVDEAHCISEWGHDFRHDYTRLGEFRERMGNPQTIALTATATQDVRQDVVQQLRLSDPRVFVAGFARPNLHYHVIPCSNHGEKQAELVSFIHQTPGAGIIYVATRRTCQDVAVLLSDAIDRPVAQYHGGMQMEQRRDVQDRFMSGQVPVVVATNAFGMGIDKPDVRFVIHYQMPGTLEAYYQEAGRAGRDGDRSQCVMMYSASDRYVHEFFISSSFPPRDVIRKVYEYFRDCQSDPIEMTQEEVKGALNLPVGAEAVGTCERLLEKSGVLERLEPRGNMAAVRIETDEPRLVDLLPKQARVRRRVLQAIQDLVGSRRHELVYLQPQWIADRLEMKPATVIRALRELTELQAFTYVPPFRGRAVRMVRRDLAFEQLDIDFERFDARRDASMEKLQQVVRYATTGQCRQGQILRYFGEQTEPRCGHCDICDQAASEPVTQVDDRLREALVMVLAGIARARCRFGKQTVAAMLCGSQAAKIQKWKLHQLSTFGLLSFLRQSEVGQLIESLIQAGYVEKSDVDRFRPVVKLTDVGLRAMRGDESIQGVRVPATILAKLPRASSRRRLEADLSGSASGDVRCETESESAPADRSAPTRRADMAHAGPCSEPPSSVGGAASHGPANKGPLPVAVRPEYYWTWRLIADGYSMEEVAAIRRQPLTQVVAHAARAAESGLPVPADWVVQSELRQAIEQLAHRQGIGRADRIAARLPDEVTAERVALFLRCREAEKSVAATTCTDQSPSVPASQ